MDLNHIVDVSENGVFESEKWYFGILVWFQVEVEFGNGNVFNLSAEFLRIHSPAVDAKIRSIAGEKVIIPNSQIKILNPFVIITLQFFARLINLT